MRANPVDSCWCPSFIWFPILAQPCTHTHKHHTCNLQALGHSYWWDAKVSLVQSSTGTRLTFGTHTHTRARAHTHTHTQSPTLTTQYMRRAPGDKTFLHRARRTAVTDRKQGAIFFVFRKGGFETGPIEQSDLLRRRTHLEFGCVPLSTSVIKPLERTFVEAHSAAGCGKGRREVG